MNLTDRQVELIVDLLETYEICNNRLVFPRKDVHFNGNTYKIAEIDYYKVCEIIDYIKGVKKDGI